MSRSKGGIRMGRFVMIKDFTVACNTNADGQIIKEEILKYDDPVTISFKNINNVTSSFVNSLFIELMADKGLDFIKQNIIIKDSNTQINGLIRERLSFEKNKRLVNN